MQLAGIVLAAILVIVSMYYLNEIAKRPSKGLK